MAIASPVPKGPLAVTKLVRAEDGTLRTIYVDAYTGKQLDSLNGYTILNQQNYLDPNTLSQPVTPETEVTENPLEEKTGPKEPTKTAKKHSGGDTKDSRGHLDRTGFNAYGPEGKDITDTKLGRLGVGLMGSTGGGILGGIVGTAVGGPVGGLVGTLAGKALGAKTFKDRSPYAKRQKELEKKKEAEQKPKDTSEDGPLAKALTPARDAIRGVVDGIFGGEVTDDNIDQYDGHPTPTARPSNDAVAAVSRPDNPLGIGYSHPERGPWDAGLTSETRNAATRLAGTMDNPQISSAYRSPAVNASVGGAKKSAHTRGLAFDMSTKHMTDDEKQKAVEMARLSGINRIGTYPDESLHFDMLEGYNPADFEDSIPTVDGTFGMYGRTAKNAINRAPGWFTAGMTQDRFAPTPTARPTDVGAPVAPGGFVSQDERTNTGNVKNYKPDVDDIETSTVSNVGSRTKQALAEAKQEREANRFAGVNLKDASPAQFAGLGLTTRSPAQISAMAQTIAGELSPSTLNALAANDPVAQQELANMVSTMENRANSRKFSTLDEALTPSQYNSLSKKNMATTMDNYSKYGQVIEKNINDFMSGTLKPANYDVTSYYNPDIAKPGWGNVMSAAQKVGQHKFGVLDGPYDYAPSSAFQAERNRLGVAQVSDTRGFTPKSDYSGKNTFSGKSDSPSERSGIGRGSSLSDTNRGYSGISGGGRDSPSERSGGRFGGSGLGSGGVKTDKSSRPGGPIDKSEKGWGGSSSKSSRGGLGSPTNDGGGKSKSPGGGF